jgi:two-component system LytT family response regulator
MSNLSIILVDDEKRTRNTLRNLISMNFPSATVVAEAQDIDVAFNEITERKPDVVFLDIQMPGGSGFDLLNRLGNINFKLVFVTAYDQHAIQAFKYSAFDYLLKPVNPAELVSVLERISKLKEHNNLGEKIDLLMNNLNTPSVQKIVLNTQDAVHVINIADIIQCEADRNYTKFFLTDKRMILVSRSLIEYEEILNPTLFFRSHHSHLINLNHLIRVDKNNMQLILTDNILVPLATRKKEVLIGLLNKVARA